MFSGNNAWAMWNFRAQLVRHFVERGFRVSVTLPRDDVFFQKFRELGAEVYEVTMNAKGTNPLADARVIGRYVKLMRRLRPDLSITFTIKPNIYAGLAARWTHTPYLPVTTGLGYVFIEDSRVSRVAKLLYRVAFRGAEKVWFLNRDDVESFRAARLVAKDKVELLPGEGIDLTHFEPCPLPAEGVTFLFVGRMLRDKGVLEFVEAARRLRERHPSVRWLLLGGVWEDNPAAVSREQLEAWNAEGTVEWLGQQEDVRPYLRAATCVVLPSYREGVPRVLLEGAALARPVIATDAPGCRDVVEDGVNGFLCEVRSAESLAGAMERLLALTPEERAEMGRRGRRLVEERFDLKRILAQYDEAVDRLFSGPAA